MQPYMIHLKQSFEGLISYIAVDYLLMLIICIAWLFYQGLREAIKNSDTAAVKKLLSQV